MAIYNGTNGNDTLWGSTANVNDTLNGGLGNDIYKYALGQGSDTLYDTGGSDTLQLEDPNSLYTSWNIYRSANNLIFDFYGKGKVTISNQYLPANTIEKVYVVPMGLTYNFVNSLNGTAGIDLLVGTIADDTMNGYAGIDLIHAGQGNDTVYGGDGNDEIYGGDGNDTLYGQIGSEEMYGNAGNDKLYGGDGDDELNGGRGADIIDGGAGRDRAQYNREQSAGIVANFSGLNKTVGTLTLASGKVLEKFDNSQDTLIGIEGIEGTDFADVFYGGGSQSVDFWGNAGNDTFYGGAINSWTNLGYYDDPAGVIINLSDVSLTVGAVTIAGGKARDGWGNTDTIVFGAGDIAINGSDFNDFIHGRDSGPDSWLNGRAGNDTIDGGSGDRNDQDTVAYDNDSPNGVIVNLSAAAITANGVSVAAGHASDGFGGTDTLISIESVVGSNLNDVIYGSVAKDWYLDGRGGNDTVNGGGGADSLYGGDGNDVLIGGSDADYMNGGNGSDTYFVDNTGDFVHEVNDTASGGGIDQVNSFLSAYTLSNNVENGCIMSTVPANLTGNALGNLLYAGSGNNVINGDAGIDTVSYLYGVTGTAGVTVSLANAGPQPTGGSGSDTLTGIERLIGSNFNDNLTGGIGNNILTGGLGQDTLRGNGGNDIFDFNTLAEMSVFSASADIIRDFNAGDKIDLSTLDANSATSVNDAFSISLIIGSANFTAPGQLKFTVGLLAGYADSMLWGNTDADVTPEFVITLNGVSSLNAADLIL